MRRALALPRRAAAAALLAPLALALASPARSDAAQADAAPAPSAQASAVQSLAPAEGAAPPRIGQPLRWSVRVEGGTLARIAGEESLEARLAELGFVLLDGPEDVLAPSDGAPAARRAVIGRAWRVMSLDSGARATPELEVVLASGESAAAAPAAIEVLGDLAPGEDAPRPARSFRSVPDASWIDPGVALAVVAALVTLPPLAVFVAVRRRRAARESDAPAGPSARERLAQLDPAEDPLTLVAALGPLVRELADAAMPDPGGAGRAALTDEEWLAALRAGGATPPELADAIARLVEESAEARFAGRRPSSLAARERLAEARSLAGRFTERAEAAGGRG